MISQTLSEKLLELRLTAFREGLREQTSNPKYAELSFEERLLLLVELECMRRSDSRIKRRLKQAEFPMSAVIEDLDFVPNVLRYHSFQRYGLLNSHRPNQWFW